MEGAPPEEAQELDVSALEPDTSLQSDDAMDPEEEPVAPAEAVQPEAAVPE